MSHYLGMDAGGTKTTCVLADDATVLARATAGSIKVMRVADAEAEANLVSLLREVSLQSGVGLDSVACTCVGLAGISVDRVRQWTSNALQARVSGRLLICGDEEIALDGAFFGETGVLVMAGTGSNVVGRTKDGVVFHIGGWGPVLSDEGSGYWIGMRAASTVMHALDMGVDTRLQAAVMQQWRITTIAELVDLGNRTPGPDFSQLAPVVAQCADEGDAVARTILTEAGGELGRFATYALERVKASAGATKTPLRLAFTGSVLSKIPQVRDALVATVRSTIPDIEIHSEAVDSAMGALWRARHC